jgi:hypothetical protein
MGKKSIPPSSNKTTAFASSIICHPLFQRLYWVGQYPRPTSKPRNFLCLVTRPETRFRHKRNELGFMVRRMSLIVSGSLSPNVASITSNGVRSSHAISTTRDMSDSESAAAGLLMRQG